MRIIRYPAFRRISAALPIAVASLAAIILALASSPGTADAYTLTAAADVTYNAGQKLMLNNESVTVEFVSVSAGFNNRFGRALPNPADPNYAASALYFICQSPTPPGTVVNAGTFTGVQELVFYLRNTASSPGPQTWFTGPGNRNSDGLAHARMTALDATTVLLEWEDLNNGGDHDFDDCVVEIVITPLATSTPTRTSTNTPTNTSTPTSTTVPSTGTFTATATNTATSTPTATNTPTDTDTPTPTPTSTEEPGLPPVALFSFLPEDPFEGDTVQFEDRTYDPDEGNTITGWEWEIDGQILTSQHPLFVFPDEGTYPVCLTVTSSDESSVTVCSGETASDDTPIPLLVVRNADPIVNALNVEALAGQDAPIIARFVDPGWVDEHTADLMLSGTPVPETLREDNNPAYGSGIVEGVASAEGSQEGLASVYDADGGSGSDTFDFTIIADDPQRHEPNAQPNGAPVLESDGSYLSYIQSRGDIDMFEVKLPGNRALPPGSEVLVTLRDLPADFDLALLTLSPDGTVDPGESGEASFSTAPFTRSPFTRSPFTRSPFTRSPFTRSPFTRSPFTRSSFTFDQLPISQLAFTGLEGEEIIGTDIGLGELGLSAIESAGVRVAGFSANRGIDPDVVLARTDVTGDRIFIAVIGANGEFQAAPYRLQVEASAPLDLVELLGSEACTGSPLIGSGQATSSVATLFDGAGSTTLYVTQRERMRAVHGMDDTAWTALMTDLTALASHPAAGGDIISLPSTIYDAWDVSPCSIEAANAVTAQIAAIIGPLLPLVENVVFIGDDGIVPFRREPDQTAISNERDYAIDSFLRPGSPLFASIALGYNLTDDYYTDVDPIAWQGRHLYVPDVPSGRLVETPVEIGAQAAAFVASNGQLNPTTGFVSGYDFFDDGADAMASTLGGALPTTALISDTWTSDDLRCGLLGIGGGCTPATLSAPNAHFTHYAALSASGFNNITLDDFLAGDELPGSPLPFGSLAFSMGCHAGFNAPDRDSLPADPGLGLDPAMDFAQAMAIQRSVFIASTGYGLGDDIGLGGTELLMTILAEDLTSGGGVTAGAALMSAKRSYINGLGAITVYDEKSTIQTTLYGLPMYAVSTPGGGGGAAAEPEVGGGAVPEGFDLTVIDGEGSTTTLIDYEETVTPDGSFVKADGVVGSTAPRALQPRVVHEVDPGGDPVHSAILYGGTYEDTFDFNPVLARPVSEWEVNPQEPKVCLRSFWPSELSTVNTLTTFDGLLQSVVFTPGQFQCESPPGGDVSGQERLFSSMTFELLRCDSDDFVPPVVHSVELMTIALGTVHVTVDATDASGIERIVALKFSAGTITPTFLDIPPATAGPYELDVTGVGPDDTMVLGVQDGACNVTWATGKGANLRAMLIDPGADKLFIPGDPEVFEVKVFNYSSLTGPLYFEWDFGDGAIASGTLLPGDLTPDGLGNVTFTVSHPYIAEFGGTATVRVLDAEGAIAVDAIGVACDEGSDVDADLLSVCAEAGIGTDPLVVDTDGDGCSDGEEVLQASQFFGGNRDPLNGWDFYDVPTPALRPADTSGVRNKVVLLGDALSVFYYVGTVLNGGPNVNGVDYDSDLNANSVADGQEYDRRPSTVPGEPWRSGPPNNVVTLGDALVAVNQVGHSCIAPP